MAAPILPAIVLEETIAGTSLVLHARLCRGGHKTVWHARPGKVMHKIEFLIYMHAYLWIMTKIPWKKNAQTTTHKSRDPTRINVINTRVPGNQSHTGEQINRSRTKTGTQLSLTNSIHTRWACSPLNMQSNTADGSTTSNIIKWNSGFGVDGDNRAFF